MRIWCLSDLHGTLPRYGPSCDAVVIAGDVCPNFGEHYGVSGAPREASQQITWWNSEFVPWAESIKRPVFLTWGNHDWAGQLVEEHLDIPDNVKVLNRDAWAPGLGLAWFGTPWTLAFHDWAFQTTERGLEAIFDSMDAAEADVWVVHQPPYGVCDDGKGSSSVLEAIRTHQPALVVCGHIHEGRGVGRVGNTLVVNASVRGNDAQAKVPGIVIELDHEKGENT